MRTLSCILLLALLLAACAALAPAPTATPIPTGTPAPPLTATATRTPTPTATPWPATPAAAAGLTLDPAQAALVDARGTPQWRLDAAAGLWIEAVPAWAQELVGRLEDVRAFRNTEWLRGPEGMIVRKSENPVVQEYEKEHGLVGAPVPIKDRRAFTLEGKQLLYRGQEVGWFEGEVLVFADPKTGEEVRVPKESLRWAVALTDDGLNREGKLVNQRVVVRLEVQGEAPENLREAGYEGKWVKWVLQEGEWHRVPEPELMEQAAAALQEGKSVAEALGSVREALPADWRDLPVVESKVLDLYLQKVGAWWGVVKEMMGDRELEEVQWAMSGDVRREVPFAYVGGFHLFAKDRLGYLGAIRVGDGVVLSVPVTYGFSQTEREMMLFNLMFSPRAIDAYLRWINEIRPPEEGYGYDDYVGGEKLWELLRAGRGFGAHVTIGRDTVVVLPLYGWNQQWEREEAVQKAQELGMAELMAWVERGNSRAVRGVVGRLLGESGQKLLYDVLGVQGYRSFLSDVLASVLSGRIINYSPTVKDPANRYEIINYDEFLRWVSENPVPVVALVGK